jgi:hypothetical protein
VFPRDCGERSDLNIMELPTPLGFSIRGLSAAARDIAVSVHCETARLRRLTNEGSLGHEAIAAIPISPTGQDCA